VIYTEVRCGSKTWDEVGFPYCLIQFQKKSWTAQLQEQKESNESNRISRTKKG